ncbi:DUF2782 domain-containing protein [Pseudomethylobacillus aquaticus]|uniref:DUF2782 domain-containing protein n=1 Tax=Pseudomethylobacillus aquaticus TaxID=2676064 RepID=A0A3N0V0J3_9PROT|nr:MULTISPECIES: DUF2782 domain-containing protein [Methylophilaceae]ROH86317.1 DUF2782 domain-containing protein [Pseudomethylobacillus aquaticus]
MRLIRCLLLLATVLPVLAYAGGQPPVLEPLPEPPPPPAGMELDPNAEPEVTIIQKGEDTVEEYRINGELYMQKITPAGGKKPYYLLKEDQEGGWSRMDGPNPPLVIPKWVIFNF